MALKPSCEACGRTVEVNDTHYKKVEGWVKSRKKGGPNEVALRKDLKAVMHHECMTMLKRGILPGQVAMDMNSDQMELI